VGTPFNAAGNRALVFRPRHGAAFHGSNSFSIANMSNGSTNCNLRGLTRAQKIKSMDVKFGNLESWKYDYWYHRTLHVHIRWNSIHRSLYYNFFSASLCVTFPSDGTIRYIFFFHEFIIIIIN
jgi:hypothetical protein